MKKMTFREAFLCKNKEEVIAFYSMHRHFSVLLNQDVLHHTTLHLFGFLQHLLQPCGESAVRVSGSDSSGLRQDADDKTCEPGFGNSGSKHLW